MDPFIAEFLIGAGIGTGFYVCLLFVVFRIMFRDCYRTVRRLHGF